MIGASCCLFDWLGLSRLAGLRSAQAGQFTPRAQTQKKRGDSDAGGPTGISHAGTYRATCT
jgi:hypothetical protein